MWNNESNLEIENGYTDSAAASNTTVLNDSNSEVKRGQTCVPVMIAHVNRHGDNLSVWGLPVRLVTLVAIIKNVEIVSTKVKFIFQDETGTLNGVKWLDADAGIYQCPVPINSYARIYGSVRSQNNENFVTIMNIQPLEHLNELLAHLMEVTLVCLDGKDSVKSTTQKDQTFVNSHSITALQETCGLTRDQALVYEIIKEESHTEFGAERCDVKQKLPPQVINQLDRILEFLSSEGHIYTTKTDDFFKVI